MKKKKLSNSEELLLNIFWEAGVPLTSLELLELSRKKSEASNWSINYIHKMIGMLQEKKLLEVCGFVKEGKRYVRQLQPCINKEEYIADMLSQQGVNTAALAKIAMALVKKQKSQEGGEKQDKMIAELEQMIDVFEKTNDMSD